MIKKITLITLVLSNALIAQNRLADYLQKGMNNSPSLKDFQNLQSINTLDGELNKSENSAFQTYLSADYLFAPYFNNNGHLISTNPFPNAVGYDAGITNGGLYSAQLNVEKNIFNGAFMERLQEQNDIYGRQYQYGYVLEKHNLQKSITDQYLNAYKSMCQYNLSKETTDNLADQLTVIEDNVKNGYTNVQNYLMLKIELQNQKTNMRNLLQQYKNDLMQLNASCGIKDTSLVNLHEVFLSIHKSAGQSEFIKKYTLDSLASVSDQSVFETKYLPQLKLFLNTGLNAVELDGIQRKFGFSVGLNFSLPLYDGGQKDISRQQKIIAQQTIGEYKKYSLLNLELQKHNSIQRIESLRQSIFEISKQLKEYHKLISMAQNQVSNGDMSMIDYLILLKNYIDLKNNKIETEINYQMEINNYNYWNW